MKSGVKRTPLMIAAALSIVAAGGIHAGYVRDFWGRNYASDRGLADNLAPDQMLMQLFGFREFLAGILWVRADSFFDDGNYDAVLPIIQVCTVLDPKQIDIFSTGMWHIAYNFTDEEQRSDRRYVPSALALGKVGSAQNPNTYELFFETGWIWYHKIDDEYHQSVKWFTAAHEREDMQQGRKSLLANAFLRNNEIRRALATYAELLDETQRNLDNNPGEYMNFQMRDTVEGNLDTMIVRMVQRGWLASERKDPSMAYDTYPPFDVGFSARATVEDARVVSIVGTWNVAPVGTRVRVILRDANMPGAVPGGLDWDMNKNIDLNIDRDTTFMQDQLFVRNRRFRKRIDMSRDPTMYPISERSDKFILEFYYDPRSAPPHIQDKFGYNGEGFTDSNFLNTEIRGNKRWEPTGEKDTQGHTKEWKLVDAGGGHKVMFTSLEFTRDQLLRRSEWRNKVPSVSTKNFDSRKVSNVDEGVIQVPTLRSGQ